MNLPFFEKIRRSVEKRVALMPEIDVKQKNSLDFCQIFEFSKTPIIAEIKFSSPSLGNIYPGTLNHKELAREYLVSGAQAISVLTEPEYFQGDINFVKDIRSENFKAPILLKDFVVSKKQIEAGLLYGANAVLLIASFLDKALLKELYFYCVELGLTPVVEIHSLEDLEDVLYLKPSVIGVNNRNLKTLELSLDISRNLINHIPDDCIALCESGISHYSQLKEMVKLGFDGFLVGTSLMSFKKPGLKLKELIKELNHES